MCEVSGAVTSNEVKVERPSRRSVGPDSRPFPGERESPADERPRTAISTDHPDVLTRKTLGWLSWGVALLAVANLINDLVGRPFWTVTRFIYLGDDQNVAAWYSSILLLGAAALAAKCFLISRAEKRIRPWSFALLAALLALMSCDEIARFHEIMGDFASRFYDPATQEISRHAAWVWIGGPIVIGAFGFFVFLLQAPLRVSPGAVQRIGAGFTLIVVGGVILEATINWMNHEELQWLWNAEVIAEETLEMAGTMLVAYGLAHWIKTVRDSRRAGSPASLAP